MFKLFYNKKKDANEEEREEIVYVDKDTHIEGDIKTDKLIVEGSISGTVWAKKVIIKNGSFLKGEVFTSSLLLDDDIKCDCEFHIDRRFDSKNVQKQESNIFSNNTENKMAAAV